MIGRLEWSTDRLIPDRDNAFGTSGPPSVVMFQGKLCCAHAGRSDSGWVWYTDFDGATWSADILIPDENDAYGTTGTPSLVEFRGKLYCIREGRGGSGWVWCANYDGTNWSTDQLIPSPNNAYGTSGPPALVVFKDLLYCIREQRGDEGWLMCATFDGETWSDDAPVVAGGLPVGTSGPPGLAYFQDKLFCIHEGRDDDGWLRCTMFDGTAWSEDTVLYCAGNQIGTSGAPALAVLEDKLYCVREGRGNSGWLWCATFDGANWNSDELVPDDVNAVGTSGRPGLCSFQMPSADTAELFCIHEGRSDSGWLWLSRSGAPWLQRYYSKIQDKTLLDLCLPGTHDSGTFSLTNSVLDTDCDSEFVKKLWNTNLPGLRDRMRAFARTQNTTIIQQLECGIRYLDFRIGKLGDTFYLCHFIVGADLATALSDVKGFLDDNPNEIVVVKSAWVGGDDGRDDYLPYIKTTMGLYYSDASSTILNSPLKYIVDSGTRFIFADGGNCINSSSYAEKQDASEILEFLEADWFKGPYTDSLWEIQFVCLPRDQSYVWGVIAGLPVYERAAVIAVMCVLIPPPLSSLVVPVLVLGEISVELYILGAKSPTSLEAFAQRLVSSNLVENYIDWTDEQVPPKSLNLLISDFFYDADIVETAIQRSID